jgi:hypothetical protein
MPRREYEFDIAPELVAALVRGRPGPLRDRAMRQLDAAISHNNAVGSIDAEYFADLEGGVSAHVEGVVADVPAVGDRGAFGVGSEYDIGPDSEFSGGFVGGLRAGLPGGHRGMSSWLTAPKRLRHLSRFGIPWSLLEQLPDDPRSQSSWSVSGGPLLPRNDTERALYDAAREASRQATDPTGAPPAAAGAGVDDRAAWSRKADARWDEYFRLRDPIKVTDNPDSTPASSGPVTAGDWHSAWTILNSFGGLGHKIGERRPSRITHVPSILRAVDPAPDGENQARDTASQIRHWAFWLIDPTFDG